MKKQLLSFPEQNFANIDISQILNSEEIRKIIFFVLGPHGTNIIQASQQWSKEVNLINKSDFVLCETPTLAVEKAKEIQELGVFPIFVACAVYHDMNKLFFSNPDCLVFMNHHYMKLDQMQLVSKTKVKKVPKDWLIASHPSPRFLLSGLKNEIRLVNSNSEAAKQCANGEVNACITTESARKIYNLERLHNFGSPVMLFCFGTTNHGKKILEKLIGKGF